VVECDIQRVTSFEMTAVRSRDFTLGQTPYAAQLDLIEPYIPASLSITQPDQAGVTDVYHR
jgi:hypothetical protein